MKPLSSKLILLGMLTAFLLPLNAQNISYSSSGGLNMGIGLGSSYQVSDIKNSIGGGFNIWLGTPIYHREGAIFALDWRFRFLAGYNQAYDHRANTDSSYNNIKLTHFNYDLELPLTLNRLRERTGIVLSAFIGAGITHAITATDMLDATGNTYDYSAILPNRETAEILADLDQLTDKDFETPRLNRAAILPTAGFYLGYEFSPRFALGLEHKTNFSLNENNSTFGLDLDNNVISDSPWDLNNYSGIVVKWMLGGGSTGRSSNRAQDPDPEQVAVAYPPQVDIITPFTNPYDATENRVKVTARIFNITRKEDISVKLNGQNHDFLFYSSINRVEISTNLRLGSNSLAISCQNEAGSDSDDLILLFRTPTVKNPPELKFINPPSSTEVELDRYSVQIQSRNITKRDDITLTVNGKRVYNFDYDHGSIISLDLDLNEGRNEIMVSGKNTDGTAEDRTNITYVKPEEGFPPEVKILQPVASRSIIYESSAEILAEIINVESDQDIILRINGINSNNFSFIRSTNRLIATVPFNTSTTRVNISAQNKFGSDSDSRIIIKEISPVQTPPVYTQPAQTQPVQIQPVQAQPCLQPVISFSITESGTSQLSGIVRNVLYKGDILLSVNGRQYNNWRFAPSTGEIHANLNFDPGTHTIDIHAANECGSDSESKILVIEAPCIKPLVNMSIQEVSSGGATHLVSARLQYVSNRDNVTLLVNGTRLTNFRFNPTSGQVTATLDLNPGSHNIMVVGINECGNNSDSKTITVTKPCIPPVVNFTISEVNSESATHRLSGRIQNVKNKGQVTLTVNGRLDTRFQFVPETGEISRSFRFNPGIQSIVVGGNNECGSDSESKNITLTEPCSPPSVSFTLIEVNSESATHRLSGRIQNVKNKGQVTLIVNGRPDTRFQFVPETGEISRSFRFNPGSQTIVVSGNNECGSDSESKTIAPAEPCNTPSVSFTISELNSESSSHQLSGRIQNVRNKSQVTLTVNGRPVDGFQFVPETGEINRPFRFNAGSYPIVVTANNECGSDSESKTVTVTEPCSPPTVDFTISEFKSGSSTHQLKGKIQNVKNKSQVTLTVNGSPNNGFQFIPATGEVSHSFKLNPGTTTIVVTVNNECGSDSESKNITVAEPCSTPSVDFNISEFKSGSSTHQLKGKIQNVKNKSQVTLTVNGSPNNGFQFIPATGEVSHSFKLNPGTTTIVVTVNNECGSDSESKTITVAEPCNPPLVDFNISEFKSGSSTHQLKGKIQNVKNLSQITLIVNGRPVHGFQFMPETGEISRRLKLNPGSNTIVIDVNNECGVDSKSKQVQVDEILIDVSGEEGTANPDAGWVRINPGNSSWEFCLQTPEGNYNRGNFSNPDFSYSGNASSLFIKPIAGGGKANVNGADFNLNSGQYYLFSGNLKVQVTNKRQGAMGHWSVYIESSTAPSTGKGNNRPKSPCETESKNKNR